MASKSITFRIEEDLKVEAPDPFYSAENVKVLRKRISDYEAGLVTEHNLIEED